MIKPLLILWIFLFGFAYNVNSQTIDYNQPYNSSYLAQYGISPKVFNLLLSPMYQEDVSFSAELIFRDEIGGVVDTYKVQVNYDPHYEYGNQVFVIVEDKEIYEVSSKSQIKSDIAQENRMFRELEGINIVDENEVGLIKDDGDNVVLGFTIQKSKLPGSKNFLSAFEGRVYIKSGKLEKITLTSTSEFKKDGINHNSYSYEILFKSNTKGDLLLEKYSMKASGTKKKEPIIYSHETNIIEYRNKEGEILPEFSSDAQLLATTQGAILDTFKINLEQHTFPIWGNALRKAGYELPLPWGVNIFSHYQNEPYQLGNITLNGENVSDLILEDGRSTAQVDVGVAAVMADLWILPFFNVSVVVGQMFGSTNVNLVLNEEAQIIIGEDIEEINLDVDVGGPMLGAGLTLAGGYKSLFATVDFKYVLQKETDLGTTVQAFVITPLVGLRFPKMFNIMVGAQYQLTDTDIKGSFDLDGETMEYSLNLKPENWNWMVGINRDFSNEFTGTFQLGFGKRVSITVMMGYRF
ncbi:MAG: hypothetical protein GQ525_12030 [Draconibacterium sp.]|nr:hypothetical protein [Draconibacterium sp.]